MLHRRRFIATTAAAASVFTSFPAASSADQAARRRARSSTSPASASAAKAGAICGIWPARTSSPCATWIGTMPPHTFKTFPRPRSSSDYRVMLEKRKDIDAVMIATPDHMHAPITLAALRAGKHVYVEKPMAHTIEEARVMTRVAKETGLVTQMGNNGHAGEGPAADPRVDPSRGDRAGARDPLLERSAGQVVEAGPGPAHRDARRCRRDWTGTSGSAPRRERPYHPVYCPVGVAGMVRLRHRGAGRHGHPQHGPGLLRPRSRRARGRRGRRPAR